MVFFSDFHKTRYFLQIKSLILDDKIYFSADSMALISKGMVCIIADVYSGSSAQDINDFDQSNFNELKLDTLLTPGRSNGVYSMLKQVIDFAN